MATHKHSKSYRQDGNRRTVDLVISGKMEALYAKVIKHLGGDRVSIHIGSSDGVAVIRGALRSKGKVPIYSNDIVLVLPNGSNFELIGVLNSKQASEYAKNNPVDTVVKEEAFEFDYATI
jgi:hypothetical protein